MKPFNETNKVNSNLDNIGDFGFHGDVIVEKIDKLPADFDNWPIIKDRCLAYGEATGHIHQLDDPNIVVRENPQTGERVFEVKGNIVYLKHQEHKPVAFRDGVYKHGIQREYDHFNEIIREVAD